MTRYVAINLAEMESHLTSLGFQRMNVPGTVECVFGKLVRHEGKAISVRVYTAINPNGESRGCGEDAIRVIAFAKDNEGDVFQIGKVQRVLRVAKWRDNLSKAITNWVKYWKVCPACGNPMAIRNGKRGAFWGCSTYRKTKCNGKPKAADITEAEQKQDDERIKNRRLPIPMAAPVPIKEARHANASKPKSKPPKARSANPLDNFRIPANQISPQQKAAEEVFLNTNSHLILPSRAGGGKTTMLKHLASFRAEGQRWKYMAFNKRNAREGQKKLPREVGAVTTHAFCARMLRDAKVPLAAEPDNGKTYQVLGEVYPAMSDDNRRRLRKAMFKLTDLCKNFNVKPGVPEEIRLVLSQYTFELNNDAEIDVVVECVDESLKLSMPGAKFGTLFDYNDMLWWPCLLGLQPPHYHTLFLDEVQDFNACQLEIVRRCMTNGSRIVAVGDPYQACYRFRGADSDAFDKMQALLSSDPKRSCEQVLLPTNYRSGRAILEYVRETTVVKDIEAAPGAIEGEVRLGMSYDEIISLLAEEYTQAA